MADSIYAPKNQHKLNAAQAADAVAAAPSSNSQPNIAKNQAGNSNGSHRAHPHLTQPLLYISGVDAAMADKELAGLVFQDVLPVRLKIDRDVPQGQTASGTVEFQTLDKAEKAYAIVRPPIQLRIEQDASSKEPVASAKPRLVKQLPSTTDDSLVYDLFRRFGPLRRAQCLLTNTAGIHTGFKGMALLEYYDEEDAKRAEAEMHCSDVDGSTISVAVDSSTRKPSTGFRPSAAAFVPSSGMSPSTPSFVPSAASSRSVSAGSSASIYASTAPSSTFQTPSPAHKGARGPSHSRASNSIDPRNLFVKNLDATLTTQDLLDVFRAFGQVVSALVKQDEQGKSKGFGFVSFTTAEEAQAAIRSLDNTKLGSKKITVCLHESKKIRQEKLATRLQGLSVGSTDGSEADAASRRASTDASEQAPQSPVPAQTPLAATSLSAGISTSASAQAQRSVSSTSSVGDASGSATERERLLKAVISVSEADAPVEDITDMLASLPKKDRAMALFSPEFLKQKVDEAKDILDITDESGENLHAPRDTNGSKPASVLKDATNGQSTSRSSSTNDAKASLGASAQKHTLSSLAALPAAEIIRLAQSSPSSLPPLAKADPEVVKSTDEFIDSLQGKAPHDQKQKLGDKLFKKIRSFGVKGAPKLTIHLLDSEDLRSLAHLMDSYDEVLKEKVDQKVAAGLNK
ncbi:Polyadenylate-binding protein/Hyperplastic disc protein [Kalmanozyma brasiliensis GHG001]|uniref:Uncharacterized protein n=1 Tax=Kalmanozyma brasiliensis (strain GHG001) TaxID=1365824 RepID=V5EJK9_KALBG|nr:Polyadenylate-binding protein/Hyperplastic disc protein [Kalmanozyma brasiliensis GHG001]EST04945.1 Polyadenylate-binding protein/Hyperplastic disc protein [Kalmanozyma brasiliensis GHG001]